MSTARSTALWLSALLEALEYDESGQPRSTTFMDYLLPSSAELPDFILAGDDAD